MQTTLLLDILADGYTLGHLIGMFIVLIISSALYFLPAIIGHKKRRARAIFWLNLLLGWTGLGWLGALIWSITTDSPSVVLQPVLATPVSVADELTKLQALRDQGILTAAEFQQQRERLLAWA